MATFNNLGKLAAAEGMALGGDKDDSAIMDMTSTTQGVLAPRMTNAQKEAISSPATGLLVYDTDDDALNYYCSTSSQWCPISNSSHADYYVSSSAETTISSIGAAVKVAGTTTNVTAKNFTHTDNRATYTGKDTHVFQVTASISMTSAGNNVVASLFVYKNGSVIAASEQQRRVNTGTDVGNAALNVMVELAENDYIEIWIANETTTANFTVEYMNVAVIGV